MVMCAIFLQFGEKNNARVFQKLSKLRDSEERVQFAFCMPNSLLEYMYSHIARETILLLINNIH
jgi:hypothetical protein